MKDALGLLDCLSFGVAWVSPAGTLAGANAAARAHLNAGRALQLTSGLVAPVDQADLQSWNRSLQSAARGRRDFLTLCRRSAPFAISLLPVPEYGHERPGLVAMVFGALENRGGISLHFFGRSFGLTPAEQLVLDILSDGCSVAEAAKAIGCSVHTVRTHVRSILGKCAEPNLRKLLCRVGALPPVGARSGFGAGDYVVGFGDQPSSGRAHDD